VNLTFLSELLENVLLVTGDILGSTRTNLGKLLKTPTGCGEQNMLNFAPDVFVTLYLQQIGRLTEEMRKTATQHMIDGYMNQMRLECFFTSQLYANIIFIAHH